MQPIWFIRMAKWVRRPPSASRVKLVLAVIAIALLIVGAEKLGFWPDWAEMERRPFKLPTPR